MKKVCMVGTGYVGLVTGAGLAKLGHDVTCVDVDAEKIKILQNGGIPFFEKDLLQLVHDGLYAGNLHFTTSLEEGIKETPYIFVAVATPQSSAGEPNLSQLFKVADSLAALTTDPKMVIIKSTVPIGSINDFNVRLKQGSAKGKNFKLICCPEFLAEGSAVHDFFFSTRTIFGAPDEETAREVGRLFEGVSGPRIYTSIETAQLIKYASNSFLASRVAYINEISRICELFGVDVRHVEQGMLLDPRFGNSYLNASIGYGGACLPKDLAALIYTARSSGYEPLLCDAIAEQNKQQIQHTIDQICQMVGEGEKVTIFGISFKAGTSDVRNSLTIKIIQGLIDRFRIVVATDPEALEYASSLPEISAAILIKNPWEAANQSDAQVFLTSWPEYKLLNLERLYKVVNKARIFDGPGIFDPQVVERIGFKYIGIGRVKANKMMVIDC